MKTNKATKRDLFKELAEGVVAMKQHREKKITLRTHKIPVQPRLDAGPKFFIEAREALRMSRKVFARAVFIPERTLEKWEQGRSKPNPEAVALVALVRHYPETMEQLKKAVQRVKTKRARQSNSAVEASGLAETS
jgi:putative transcriptional regulator